jgi:hypothetical protein
VAELRGRGVKVEDYDTPGLKTKDGIADIGFAWADWIIDPRANALGILQINECSTEFAWAPDQVRGLQNIRFWEASVPAGLRRTSAQIDGYVLSELRVMPSATVRQSPGLDQRAQPQGLISMHDRPTPNARFCRDRGVTHCDQPLRGPAS